MGFSVGKERGEKGKGSVKRNHNEEKPEFDGNSVCIILTAEDRKFNCSKIRA